MGGDAVDQTVSEQRLEACRREDHRAHEIMWAHVRTVEDKVTDLRIFVERTKTIALVIQGVVTLLASSAGVALIQWLTTR